MNTNFNYKLEKDEYKPAERKSVSNSNFGTMFYSTNLFYKHLTRFFFPVNNE